MKAATLGPLTLAADFGDKPGELTLAGVSLVTMGGEYGIRLAVLSLQVWLIMSFVRGVRHHETRSLQLGGRNGSPVTMFLQ